MRTYQDSPPQKTRRDMDDWIEKNLARLTDEDYVHAIKNYVGRDLLLPEGMPDEAPRDTADFKRWKAWAEFLDVCAPRAAEAARATTAYFERAGTKNPSRQVIALVFRYELGFIRKWIFP